MFQALSERLADTFHKLRGNATLDENNLKEPLKQVRNALLDADVALDVVNQFISEVKQKALGLSVNRELTPEQVFIKTVNDELIRIMGDAKADLRVTAQPTVILLAGLQGSGKTTTTAKLGRWLKERENKKVMVASCDVYRPAAIEQLKTLAGDLSLDYFPSEVGEAPVAIAQKALEEAKKTFQDVVIIDTAGRLHIDAEMMQEIAAISEAINPHETLFVVDAMTGQEAANTAKAFGERLTLTGVVVTKLDGDARGGAALSVPRVSGAPIKFVGEGEKTDALEPFHPDRMASRILGMGDVLTLVEEIERKVDKVKAEKLAKKLQKGRGFDFNDLRDQIQQMKKMGGMAGIMSKLPGMAQLPAAVKEKADDGQFEQMLAIINSMTKRERRNPQIIKGSRRKRIAFGSGTQIADVNRLLKQHEKMQKMMKKLQKAGGMANLMRGMEGMVGRGGGGMPF